MDETTQSPPAAQVRAPARTRHWDTLLVIGLGGALGSLARYGLSRWLPSTGGFAVGTLLANLLGCLLIGVLMVLITEATTPHRLLRPFLGVGVLGGFTTFSSYVADVLGALRAGHPITGFAYLATTLAGSLLAVAAGMVVTRAALGRGKEDR